MRCSDSVPKYGNTKYRSSLGTSNNFWDGLNCLSRNLRTKESTILAGNPLAPKNPLRVANSEWNDRYQELTWYALKMADEIAENLRGSGIKLKKLVPKPEKDGFL